MSEPASVEAVEEQHTSRSGSGAPTATVVGVPVTALGFKDHVSLICKWAQGAPTGRIVCVANVHMLVEAQRHRRFRGLLHRADLVTPDGMPLVWVMRSSRAPRQHRVAGMDLLPALCSVAERRRIPVYFLGSTEAVLGHMRKRLRAEHPQLSIVGMESPPFRPLTDEEDNALVRRINASGARIVFVSLGCPKQERWMHSHRKRIGAVMVGVGGAFPVYAGLQRRAPRLLRFLGLEWFYRLAREPRRLWKRYLITNFLFCYYVVRDAWFIRNRRRSRRASPFGPVGRGGP